MEHTRVVTTKYTPSVAYRAFNDTTLVCFIVNEHTVKCFLYKNIFKSSTVIPIHVKYYIKKLQTSFRAGSHK